ncbi:hypothetical protein [Actinophytocola sp. NPDC049390]|uniref:hypothetical protein n=1 Tax=Actinophytocola sp. NPDC049390 TaxID=3363894 RepID=UPI0037B909A8
MDETSTAARRRDPLWIGAAVLAGVLVAALVVGAWRPGAFVVFGWLRRPGLFGTAALVLLAVAAWLGVLRPWRRFVLTGVCGVLAAFWAMIAMLTLPFREDLEEVSHHPSHDDARELVVYGGMNVIDPTWELRLLAGTGLATREWDLGCVNSDVDSLTRVEWVGTNELRVHLSRKGAVDVVLDEATGRPSRTLEVGC